MIFLHNIQFGNNPTTYLASFIALSTLIGSWHLIKYKQKLSEEKDKEQDKRIKENEKQVTNLFSLFDKVGTEISLLTESFKHVKTGLDNNTENDKHKDYKMEELRKELYAHIGNIQEKGKKEVGAVRDKVQELGERVSKIEK